MSTIRLNKLCKALNVGADTLVKHLAARYGIMAEKNPNAKVRLTDEQCRGLMGVFLGNKVVILPWLAEPFSDDPERNRELLNRHKWNDNNHPIFLRENNRIILLPVFQNGNYLEYWTISDLENAGLHDWLENNRMLLSSLGKPSGLMPVAPYVKEDETPIKVSPKPSVQRMENQKIEVSPFVTKGKIDLSSINSRMRPEKAKVKKKHKIEHTERTEVSKETVSETIREIWQRFVDVQEQLIRQKSMPITIVPEETKVFDNKISVLVDESGDEEKVRSILNETLGIEDSDLSSGVIFVDAKKWNKLSEEKIDEIRGRLAECYVEMDSFPSFMVSVDYGNGATRFDQLTIKELQNLDETLKGGGLFEGRISDKVAFISKITVDREAYFKYLFGDHYVRVEKRKSDEEKSQVFEFFQYRNQIIPWEAYQQYQNIGLYCKEYRLYITIDDKDACEQMRSLYDCYSVKHQAFELIRTFSENRPYYEGVEREIYANIDVFVKEAELYCTKSKIKVDIIINYAVNYSKLNKTLIRDKFLEVEALLQGRENCSFNVTTGAIGIDFNWREQNVWELVDEIEQSVPFVSVNRYEEHRMKCNVEVSLVGYDKLKSNIEKKYENASVENDVVNHRIKIKLPCYSSDSFELMESNLRKDLSHLEQMGMEAIYPSKKEGMLQVCIHSDEVSRQEEIADGISSMKRADFGIIIADKEVPFGKLIRADYPNLTFDVNIEKEEIQDQVVNLFEEGKINEIVPILTGELEKISRLKNTFTMASTGTDLVNPNLQRYIFDSSEAKKTNDISLLLRSDGVVYGDISRHLLSPYINESQKRAIIKAMFAEDLAVIQGPPGTGKSTAIAELIWQLVRKGMQHGNTKERILLTSETNLAVDNAISRIVNNSNNLVKPIRFGEEEKLETEGLQFSLELMKRWVEEGDSCLVEGGDDEEDQSNVVSDLILKNWLENISRRSFFGLVDEEMPEVVRWRNLLKHPDKTLRQFTYDNYVRNANVIGATCSSIGDKRAGNKEFNGFTPFFKSYSEVFYGKNKKKAKIEFTTVIQDESSKATPAELVLPFVYGKRSIVIGDHRQLPPMLDHEDFESTLDFAYRMAKDDDERSELKRLKDFVEEHFDEMEISHFQKLYENIDSSLKGTFNLQYRMHPDINQVIEQFYQEDGGLRCGLSYPINLGVDDPDISNWASRYHGIDIPGVISPNTHVLFIDTKSPEMADGTSRVNYGEVETIDKLLSMLEKSESYQEYLKRFSKDEDKQIGIISFYGKQIRQLRNVAHTHPDLIVRPRISTVDRFQGMERNIVIVSMVRSNIIQSAKNQKPNFKRYPNVGFPQQTSLGFAQSPNRLNVALSRARRLLIIVGNRELFSTKEIYDRLFQTIESNKNNVVLAQSDLWNN